MKNFRSDFVQRTEYSSVIKTNRWELYKRISSDHTHRIHCASITKTNSRLFTFMWPCIVTFMWPCIVTFMWPCIVTNFIIIKPTRCTNFSNLFWNDILHISDSSSVHHQELFTVNSAMVYVIHVCRQLSSRIRMELQFHPDPAAARKLSTNLYNIYHCCVYSY
jgi:hypothetical protein